MANTEVKELAIRLTPEGAKETEDALSDVDDQFKETADETEDASRDLNRFSRKFTGALAVASGVLGGVAAKFLSMVPAVQDAFIGVGSVIDGLIIQFEEEFGPAIRDIGDEFFELAQQVRSEDSFAAALETAATGSMDIVTDLRNELIRLAGEYTADVAVNITRTITTTVTDPQQRQQFVEDTIDSLTDPRQLADWLVTGIPGGQTTVDIAEAFTEGVLGRDLPFEAFSPGGNTAAAGMFDRGTTPTSTTADVVNEQQQTNSLMRRLMREVTGGERDETTVAIEGKSPSVDDDLSARPV